MKFISEAASKLPSYPLEEYIEKQHAARSKKESSISGGGQDERLKHLLKAFKPLTTTRDDDSIVKMTASTQGSY